MSAIFHLQSSGFKYPYYLSFSPRKNGTIFWIVLMYCRSVRSPSHTLIICMMGFLFMTDSWWGVLSTIILQVSNCGYQFHTLAELNKTCLLITVLRAVRPWSRLFMFTTRLFVHSNDGHLKWTQTFIYQPPLLFATT